MGKSQWHPKTNWFFEKEEEERAVNHELDS